MPKSEIEASYNIFEDKVNSMKAEFPNDSGDVVFFNTIGSNWASGEMSYPNFGGKCREYQYPDARILAEIMEENNFDFRVVVLLRNPMDIILSTSIHRHFSTWRQNARLYTKMIDEVLLKNQLLRLSSDFIQCLDYDKLPELNEGFGDFLGTDDSNYQVQKK